MSENYTQKNTSIFLKILFSLHLQLLQGIINYEQKDRPLHGHNHQIINVSKNENIFKLPTVMLNNNCR